jgi:phage-related protein
VGVNNRIITFDGASSDALGITIEGFPNATVPERYVDTVEVPGRNGLLLIDHGTYKNYDQTYTAHWRIDGDDGVNAALSEWFGKIGYKRLYDSLWPNHYRLAVCNGSVDTENRNNVLGRGPIVFNCKPQWFRVAGDEAIEFQQSTGGTISNPTKNNAYPLVRMTCAAGVEDSITINGTTIYVDATAAYDDGVAASGFLIVEIDCETQNAVAVDDGASLNKYITVPGDFPSLVPGENVISFGGEIGYCGITPRWWDLTP